jgi:hypothetical protein
MTVGSFLFLKEQIKGIIISMEFEEHGRFVVVELDTLTHAGCGASHGSAGGLYRGLAEGQNARLLETRYHGGPCTVLRVNLAGVADAEVLDEAELALERLEEEAGAAQAGVQVVEVGFAPATRE